MANYEMNDKELSVWAHLNEAENYLEEGQYERALDYILNARDILTGNRYGDFEDEFWKCN
ncbi:hypothetical protein [Clostridium botulinum]|uniref:hypothetical protein n=1 Tax=Clostridium botulinum TaxID=1491 RepID=UPI000465C50C|nr:hypothetical protein [Clostridium botulinum]APQ74913.1 hypothetical protein RSJ9_2463 [Clostridium botulinum]OSB13486.1 hypothetical protein B2H96_09455 [Clostridium botulinum]